ncbi:unnamed protein product [Rotaria socialis]|uniref:NAD-dependent epimerase/dehydratase domain-containing protein n=1 Tax=Rotaria socialis TaxID=392032 RepID=A0A820AVK8_9BILA|nr:unnamed protein product [Rotaria socialis]CAF3408927.1 unnamed protein product [Rotaria socialis]CAF4137183.1 unnamed protein product [Rotaria socialis]CAF4193367.1 unnamed protein product [Rotaria socialis]
MSKSILVTGANSFIGGWIIKYLLDKGYNVRGTVRSQAKESRVLDGIPSDQQCRISFVHINDITTDSFYEALHDIDGIIHVASPVHLTVTDPEKDFLLPAINGTINVLHAAHKYNQNHPKKIKRVVITSSFAAVNDASKGVRSDYSYTEKDWCPLTYADGLTAKNDHLTAYRASKTCAERAAWEFLDKEKPSFTIATICAPMVFGPRINGLQSLDDMNSSNSFLWLLITSSKDAQISDRKLRFQVDVRDVAYTHVEALERCTDTCQRYLIAAETWSHQAIADIVHQSLVIPDSIKNTTPIGIEDEKLPHIYNIDSSRAQNELGVTYIPLKMTIEDLILQFLKLKEILAQA